jgi:hypothetical protein
MAKSTFERSIRGEEVRGERSRLHLAPQGKRKLTIKRGSTHVIPVALVRTNDDQ